MKKNFIHLLFVAFFATFSSITVAQTQGKLIVKTTTASTDPADPSGEVSELCENAPKNVLAIWIEDANGVFVRTLAVWGKERRYNLTNWTKAANNDVSEFKVDNSVNPVPVDGYTGATLKTYKTITCSWDGKSNKGVVVPDGEYNIMYELTDNETDKANPASTDTTVLGNGINSNWSVKFVKGGSALSLTPADATSFGANTITWTPSTTAVSNPEIDKLYSVFPNPAKSNITINGENIVSVEILDSNGASVLKADNPKINISNLASGQYWVKIYTDKNQIVKRFIKK